MKIKVGDTVKVLYGKDAGKTGLVIKADTKKQRVTIEGVNVYKKNRKGNGQNVSSEIIDITKPLNISKVQLIDPETSKPTRVRMETIDGKKVRVAVNSGKAIDKVSKKKEK